MSEVQQRQLPHIGVADCRRIVGERFSITKEVMIGITRRRAHAWPRQMAMVLARESSGASLPRIGIFFGKDHTTVLHACRNSARREVWNQEFHQEMEEFRRTLRILAAERAELRRLTQLQRMYEELFPPPEPEPIESSEPAQEAA